MLCLRMVQNISSENFEKDVLKSEKPVLVCLTAEWMNVGGDTAQALESTSENFPDIKVFNLDIGEVDVRNSQNAKLYDFVIKKINTRHIPTSVVLFQGNIQGDRKVGCMNADQFAEWIGSMEFNKVAAPVRAASLLSIENVSNRLKNIGNYLGSFMVYSSKSVDQTPG